MESQYWNRAVYTRIKDRGSMYSREDEVETLKVDSTIRS